jgi:hypothetical protein
MSNANVQPNQAANPTEIPPELLLPNTSTIVNPWEVDLTKNKRTVKGPAAQKAVQSGVAKTDVVTVKNRANPKGVTMQAGNVTGGTNFISKYVTSAQVASNKLIDKNGELSREQYNPSKDAEPELAQMSQPNRIELLNALYQRGFFPSKTGPSVTGRDNNSVYAMEQFLAAVNPTGYTWDVAKPIIFSEFQAIQGAPGSGGGGKKYSISSDDDIINIANRVAEQTIGRRLNSGEVSKIISKVQSRERAAGQSNANETQQAPSAQTIAQSQIEQEYGQEAAMMRFGQLGASLDALLKGI